MTATPAIYATPAAREKIERLIWAEQHKDVSVVAQRVLEDNRAELDAIDALMAEGE